MTSDTPLSEAPGPHLDDDARSAALDGEATGAERAHLAGCGTCRAGVDRLRSLQVLVADVPPAAPADRQRALSAALDAFEHAAPAVAATPLVRGRRPEGRRRGSGDRTPWLGVAAVVLLLALALPLLSVLAGSDSDDAGDVAATSADEDAGTTAADDSTASAPAPPVDVGDLGDLAAGADLRPVVDRALGSAGGADQAEAAGGAETSDEGGATTPTAPVTGGDAGEGEATTTTAPTGAEEDAALEASGGGTAARAATCEPTVRQDLPDAGALLLVGMATVDGGPGLVYGFAAPTERPTVLVALVAVEGCRTVTFQSYARG